MLKELGIATIATMNFNTADISISDYKSLIVDNNNKTVSEKVDTNQFFYISPEDKEELNNKLVSHVSTMKEYEKRNQEVLKKNFDRWIIQESGEVLSLVNYILSMTQELSTEFKKEAKIYNKYESLSKKMYEIASIFENVHKFTLQYKQKSIEADEVYMFMADFIPKNQEVLKALA
ncbi:MAG: hypothetical protein U9Q04_03380 [Campylobacterota bacterium]|nr:hypothetical protein [Campylobacterota bacterium]